MSESDTAHNDGHDDSNEIVRYRLSCSKMNVASGTWSSIGRGSVSYKRKLSPGPDLLPARLVMRSIRWIANAMED